MISVEEMTGKRGEKGKRSLSRKFPEKQSELGKGKKRDKTARENEAVIFLFSFLQPYSDILK